MTTPDPITTAREALDYIMIMSDDNLSPYDSHFAAITAALDYAEKLQSALSVTQEEGRTEIARLEAEVEKLKAEADPEALVIAHMHGAQMATEKHREEIATLKAERDELEKSVSAHWKEIEHLNAATDSEITRLTSQLEQAERVIAPLARLADNHPSRFRERFGDQLIAGAIADVEWNLYGADLQGASQWIKDRQAKGEG